MATIIESFREQKPLTPRELHFDCLRLQRGSLGGWNVAALPFGHTTSEMGHAVNFSNTADMIAWLSKNVKD